MGIRDEQKEQRRLQILTAALELFVAKGYASTKITDIAEKVSMSTGLLFHYFESKEKLYEELVRTGLQGTKTTLNCNTGKAIDCFESFTNGLFSFMKAQPVVAKMFVLMAEAQRNEGTPEEARKIALQVNTINDFVPIVIKGQQDGDIREGDPLAISNAFWSAVQGIAESYAANPDLPLPNPEWIVDIVRKERA